MCHVLLDIDADSKGMLLEHLSHVSCSVNGLVGLIGALMAGQDEKKGYIGHEEMVDLGFAIEGLANISDQVAAVSFEIADAEPAVKHAEAANG